MTVHRFLIAALAILSSVALVAPTGASAATASSAVNVQQSQGSDWVPHNGGTMDQKALVNTWVKVGDVSGQSRTDASQHMWSNKPMQQSQMVSDGVKVDWNNNQWPTNATVLTAFETDQKQQGSHHAPAQLEQRSVSTLRSSIGNSEANADSHAHQTLVSDAHQRQQTEGQTRLEGWFNPPKPSNHGHSGWLGNIFQNVNVFVQNTIAW